MIDLKKLIHLKKIFFLNLNHFITNFRLKNTYLLHLFILTRNDSVFILERLLNRRETDGPNIAVKHGGSMDLNDSNVVLVCIQFEVPVYSYLRHHKI